MDSYDFVSMPPVFCIRIVASEKQLTFLPELKIDIREIGYNTYFLVFRAF